MLAQPAEQEKETNGSNLSGESSITTDTSAGMASEVLFQLHCHAPRPSSSPSCWVASAQSRSAAFTSQSAREKIRKERPSC